MSRSDAAAKKVYAWEDEVVAPLDGSRVPFEQMQALVDYVWVSEGLRCPPKVRPLKGARAAWAGGQPEVFLRQVGNDNAIVLGGQDLVDSGLPVSQEGNGNRTEIDARGRVFLQVDTVGDRNRANLRFHGDQGSGRFDPGYQVVNIYGDDNVIGWECSGAPGARSCAGPAEQSGDNHRVEVRVGRGVVAVTGFGGACVVPRTCNSTTASHRNLVEFLQTGEGHRLALGIVGNENHATIQQQGTSRNTAVVGVAGNNNQVGVVQGDATGGSHAAHIQVHGDGNSVDVLQPSSPASEASFGLSASNTRVTAQANATGGVDISVQSGSGTPTAATLLRPMR